MKPRREYTHGSRWAFCRWKDINPDGKQPVYLSRLHIIQTPWFGIFLHIIRRPDPNGPMHNHPVHFLSVILRGSYTEQLRRGRFPYITITNHIRRWFNVKNARRDFHRITDVSGVVWTLVFASHRIHEWGFLVDRKVIPWTEYKPESHLVRPGE